MQYKEKSRKMDQNAIIGLLIYGIICLGFGFYLRPRVDEFLATIRASLKGLFGTRIVKGARPPKPIRKPEDLAIKVVGTYPIDEHEFTVIVKPPIDDYERDYYDPGVTTRVNGEQWSPRQRVLMRDSLVQVTVRDGRIVGGQWQCPYTGNIYLDPAQIDIDHIVPLCESWISGAKNWNKSALSAYSRDLDNLIAVSSEANREKGRYGPDRWMPPLASCHLWYIQRWIYTKKKYNLGVSKEEILAMAKYAQ